MEKWGNLVAMAKATAGGQRCGLLGGRILPKQGLHGF